MKNIILSSTQIDDSYGCFRRLNFEQILRLRRKDLVGKEAEREAKKIRGTLFHKMLEKYYKALMLVQNGNKDIVINEDLIIAIMNWGRGYGATDLGLGHDHIEKTVRKFRDYYTKYRNDNYTIEGVEEPIGKELYRDENLRIGLEATLDLRVTNQQGLQLVIDHKSGSWEQGFLSNQFMCHAFLTGRRLIIENRCPIDGDGKFERDTHSYSDRIIEEWKESTIAQIKKLAKAAEENVYPPDFTRCKNFGGCQFYELCVQDPEHRLGMIAAEFEIVPDTHYEERFGRKP